MNEPQKAIAVIKYPDGYCPVIFTKQGVWFYKGQYKSKYPMAPSETEAEAFKRLYEMHASFDSFVILFETLIERNDDEDFILDVNQ